MTGTDRNTPAGRRARERLRPLRRKRRPPPVGDPRRLRVTLAYDGSAYSGWQRQSDELTIQETLEVALEHVTGVAGSAFASGRTDAGVHAEGQCCILDTTSALPADAVQALLRMVLPRDVRVSEVADVPTDWNPQTRAKRKLYRYTLLLGDRPAPARERTAWRLEGPFDVAAVRTAAACLPGTHDFRSFRTDPGPERRGEDTVRRLDDVAIVTAFDQVRLEFTGPGFLYMMVRNLTAALVAVGRGEHEPGWIEAVLRARDRRLVPPPAPPQGLCLVRVDYDDDDPRG